MINNFNILKRFRCRSNSNIFKKNTEYDINNESILNRKRRSSSLSQSNCEINNPMNQYNDEEIPNNNIKNLKKGINFMERIYRY